LHVLQGKVDGMTPATDENVPAAGTSAASSVTAESAATVILLRDSAAGVEVLLLERPRGRGSFPGAWVFPGGHVDPEDAAAGAAPRDEEAAARHAAVRETREETRLEVALDALVPVARWTPDKRQGRRFQTWFYYAQAPGGPVILNPAESVDHVWISPGDALARHSAGDLTLIAPTWMTLRALVGVDTAGQALARARAAAPEFYDSWLAAERRVVIWEGDVSWGMPELAEGDGPRHRLDMNSLPWRYQRTISPGR
jgi:8-oxo-dGTP pyrophosphatase MutT (NUDIX family)